MLFYYFTLVVLILVSLVLVLSILVQESKTTGLGSSFGGEPTESLFGTSTPEVLRKFSAYMAAVFVALCLIMSLWTNQLVREPVEPATAVISAPQAE